MFISKIGTDSLKYMSNTPTNWSHLSDRRQYRRVGRHRDTGRTCHRTDRVCAPGLNCMRPRRIFSPCSVNIVQLQRKLWLRASSSSPHRCPGEPHTPDKEKAGSTPSPISPVTPTMFNLRCVVTWIYPYPATLKELDPASHRVWDLETSRLSLRS